MISLLGQRIRPELEPDRFTRGALPALHVERGASADSGPETTPLPVGVRIVDAAVQPLGIEAHRIRNAKDDPLSILQHKQPLGLIAGVDRNVLPEAERVELIHPRVIAPFATTGAGDVAELREWFSVEGPSLRTVLAGSRPAV